MSALLKKELVLLFLAALIIIPAVSLADGYPCGFPYATECSQPESTVHVYMQVQPGYVGQTQKSPLDFTVYVRSQKNPYSFQGTTNDTHVTVVGPYQVEVAPMDNYQASFSSGCVGTGNFVANATCIVTMTPGIAPYNQNTSNYYPSVAPTQTPYVQQISVPQQIQIQAPVPVTTISMQYIPSLPNTGFGPLSNSQMAMLITIFAALSLGLAPYVRTLVSRIA